MPELEPNGTPAATVAAGQQPTMNDTTTTDPQQPPTAAADNAASGQQLADGQQQPEVVNPAAQKAAQEAARYRTELRALQARVAEYEAAQRAAEEAQMSELEKAQKRLAEYEAEKAQTTLQAQERITRAEVRAAATAMGLNPQLAARIVDYAAIEYDENGDPTNVAQLLAAAVKEYGLMPAASASGGMPAGNAPTDANAQLAAQLGATNPTRQNGPITVTANQYMDKAFKADFKNRYGMELDTAVLRGKAQIV